MQKNVKNEKRYRLINFICLLAVYKKIIGTGRVLGTSILRYVLSSSSTMSSQKNKMISTILTRATDDFQKYRKMQYFKNT